MFFTVASVAHDGQGCSSSTASSTNNTAANTPLIAHPPNVEIPSPANNLSQIIKNSSFQTPKHKVETECWKDEGGEADDSVLPCLPRVAQVSHDGTFEITASEAEQQQVRQTSDERLPSSVTEATRTTTSNNGSFRIAQSRLDFEAVNTPVSPRFFHLEKGGAGIKK
eukprot:PhF_6_TR29905/c1_g1_i1/m.43850